MSLFKSLSSPNQMKARRRAAVTRAVAAAHGHRPIEQLEERRMMSATLTLVNPDNLPASNRIIFDTIQNPASTTQVEHNQQTFQITDTGADPLVISSMTINGPWIFAGAPTGGYNGVTVEPGAPLSVTLSFTQTTEPAHSYNETNYTQNPNGGAAVTGSLTIDSNSSTAPTTQVTLAGYWQNLSNNNEEPSLQTITNLLAGYDTNINSTPIPDLTEGISPPAATDYGSEVTSSMWEAANPAEPVSMQELATFRTQGNASTVYWYTGSTSPTSTALYTDAGNQGQTLLPMLSGGGLAGASFTPSGAFGLRVDNEYSTDSINVANGNSGGAGHHFRFFPLTDSSGNTVPNTYLVAMDYGELQVENFDFQDHAWIVSNIRPATTPETPASFAATNGAAPVLSWTADNYSPVAYNVYRATSASGPFTLLTTTPIAATTYTDSTAPSGPVYYQLTAVDTTQTPVATSVPATASANTGPVVVGYAFTAYTGQALSINPLVSDSDTSGTLEPSTITVSVPNHGGTATVSDGLITYESAAHYTGPETFTYSVTDSNGAVSSPATITVTVAANAAAVPVANSEVTTTLSGTAIDIPVLNVDDPVTTFNLASLAITAQPADGTAAVNADGSVTYTPKANFVGGDAFKYTVADNDGQTSAIATVSINVGTEISSARGANHTLKYPDISGTLVTISLNRGIADVYFDGAGTVTSLKGKSSVSGNGLDPREIVLTGTTAGSVLSLTGSRKGQFKLGGVTDVGVLGAINAPTANLQANGTTTGSGLRYVSSEPVTGNLGGISPAVVTVATPINPSGEIQLAGVRSISLLTAANAAINLGATGVTGTAVSIAGAVTDSELTSTVGITSLKAHGWINDYTGASAENVLVSAPSIGSMTITGNFAANLIVDKIARTPALGNTRVTGAVSIGNWSVTGNAKSITVGAVAAGWGGLNVSGTLSSFTVATGGLGADLSAASISSVKVAGALSGVVKTTGNLTSLQAGSLSGALIEVGSTATTLAAATAANIGGATLGSLKVISKTADAFSDSSIIAGLIGSVVTGPIDSAGAPEGFATTKIKAATMTLDGVVVHVPAADLLSSSALTSYLSTKSLSPGTLSLDIV